MGHDDEREVHLERLKESYREVLQATKHEDDKIGRFLTAIAFLVAGALLFSSQQDWFLHVRYELGEGWPLPAIALIAFLFSVVFSVLLYILTIAAPVTRPPGVGGETRRSLLFFQLIAEETPRTWNARWNRPVGLLQADLRRQYRGEILNLADRAYTKRNRATEATHLFAMGLLFFLLSILLGIHASIHVAGRDGLSLIPWDSAVQYLIAGSLSLFPLLILHQQRAAHIVRRVARDSTHSRGTNSMSQEAPNSLPSSAIERIRNWRRSIGFWGFVMMSLGLVILIIALVFSAERMAGTVELLAVLAASVLFLSGWSATRDARNLRRTLLEPVIFSIVLALVGLAVLFRGSPGWHLALAVGIAVSPTAWQLLYALLSGWQLKQERLRKQREAGLL